MAGEERLRLPLLYGITDPRGWRGLTAPAVARLLADVGVRLVQVRDKALASGSRLAAARSCVATMRAVSGVVLVNDRTDVALLSGADGVHLGEDDLPPACARKLLGEAALVGVSTHAVATAREAMDDPSPSYVALGPIFATRSKASPHAPLGLGAVEQTARAKTRPLVVIGGIDPDDVGRCLSAGADAVAMIAGLLDGDVRANVARALESARQAGFREGP